MTTFSEWPTPARAATVLVGCLAGILLWSCIASLVFLAGTHLLSRDTVPLLQFWRYWYYYGMSHPTVGLWLKVAAGVATVLPAALIGARVLRSGWSTDNRALHGQTRWASRAERRRGGLYAQRCGLFVGQDDNGRYLRFGGPEHVACYAPTRSGKGVGLVIPNCLLYEATLVCLDVKKENWAATAGIREKAGQKVFLFDPLAPDGRTARYNPFSYVRCGTIDAFDDIQKIAQMVFPHVSGDQQFWTDSARSAFTGAAGLLAESPELPLTFGEVLRLLSSADGPRAILERIEARRQHGKPYTEATVHALEDYLKGSADLVNSIRKTVTARLSLWFNPRIDAATAASDFDLRTLRTHLHAIYVGVTPDNIARLRPLLALFFQQLVDLTIRTLPQHDTRVRHQVLLLLDEFPLLGPMPVLADALSYVAGYNIRIMLIMQSKAQLRDRDLYGPDKAAAMLENCGLEVVFGTKDQDLAAELSKRLGNDTVEVQSRSGPRFWRALQRDRMSLTASDRERALLLPQEIVRLPPAHAILLRAGMLPIRCRRIRHYADPTFKPLLLDPPEVPPIDVELRLDRSSCPTKAADAAPPVTASKPRQRKKRSGTESETTTAAQVASSNDMTAAADNAAEHGRPARLVLEPHQSENLLKTIMSTEVDLSGLGLDDGKAAVALLVDALPTVESLARGTRKANR